eukprot:1174367-Prorocentrum_minimum.AAC.1
MLRPGYFQAKVDLQSAYRSFPVNPRHWRHQALEWGGQTYMDTSLPFGAASAPPGFNRFTQALVRYMRGRGFASTLGYLDDFWLCAPTEARCREGYDLLRRTLADLGFVVSEHKCVPPTTRLVFLGIELDSGDAQGRCVMRLPDEKRVRALEACQLLAPPGSGVPTRVSRSSLMFVSGYLSHCADVVFGSRLYLRAMHTASAAIGRRTWFVLPTALRDEMGYELAWWTRILRSSHELLERSYYQRGSPDYAMFSTDASTEFGMGGFLDGEHFSVSWEQLGGIAAPSRIFPVLSETTERGHINYLELFAVYWALA